MTRSLRGILFFFEYHKNSPMLLFFSTDLWTHSHSIACTPSSKSGLFAGGSKAKTGLPHDTIISVLGFLSLNTVPNLLDNLCLFV